MDNFSLLYHTSIVNFYVYNFLYLDKFTVTTYVFIIVEARRVLIKTRVLPAGTQVIISVMREISEYSLNITTVGRDCVAKSSVDMVVVGAVQ